MKPRFVRYDFNEIRRQTRAVGGHDRARWWQPAAGCLDVVVNELALAGFKRFGRGSFGPRSKV
jgi:hypothetical protein